MKLDILYQKCLDHYLKTGEKGHPAHLLAMLMLQNKKKFNPPTNDNGLYYLVYKKEIDKYIDKVLNDFHFTKEELISYIKEKVHYEEKNYERDIIWFVFEEGFSLVRNQMLKNINDTPENMYLSKYELPQFIEKDKVKTL